MRHEMLCFKLSYIKQNALLKLWYVGGNLFYQRNRVKNKMKIKKKKGKSENHPLF